MSHPETQRIILLALGISPPGSMGGNSKIALEIVRSCAKVRPVVVITAKGKVETFRQNLGPEVSFDLHAVADFPGNPRVHPFAEALHYTRLVAPVLRNLRTGPKDILYSCSDFLLDVLPPFLLKPTGRFTWVPTLFLFVPSVFENLRRRYGFPVLKYCAYHAFQRMVFALLKRRGDLFVVTNDCDRVRFPERLRNRVFAFYGGVNVEQIRRTGDRSSPKRWDVVFCSRLHPQKGIASFLDVWRRVTTVLPDARLAVIGNGAPAYEAKLRAKAERLGTAATITWLGYVNNEAKYAIYQDSRVFVHPTVYDNNGMVAAEALCSGLPVVMYDLPSLRQVYAVGCRKVPERDRQAFAQALVRLLACPQELAAVTPDAEAVAALRAQWDWPVRVERFLGFLDGAMGNGQAAKPCGSPA